MSTIITVIRFAIAMAVGMGTAALIPVIETNDVGLGILLRVVFR